MRTDKYAISGIAALALTIGCAKSEPKQPEPTVYQILCPQDFQIMKWWAHEKPYNLEKATQTYYKYNGEGHLPIAGVSELYLPDVNRDGKILGQKMTLEEIADKQRMQKILKLRSQRRSGNYE